MALRIVPGILVGVLTFALLLHVPTRAQTALTVTLEVEAVGIEISGGGLVDFGGPWGPGRSLRAHPSSSELHVVVAPPVITNTGNVPIASIEMAYAGLEGQEASCDGGSDHWRAHATAVGQDRFQMRASASDANAWGTFTSNASDVVPGAGTGNILHHSHTPLGVNQSVPLQFELKTPDPIVAGAQGCAIALEVIAAVE